MGRKKKQFWYTGEGKCPHCHNSLHINIKRDMISPATKAVIESQLMIEKFANDRIVV